MKWERGQADVDRMIRSRELSRVAGDAADGAPWLAKAEDALTAARQLLSVNTGFAITLAYDAARFAAAGLLAQQGLRATAGGGHFAVEKAVKAQFGSAFADFGTMRRRRNEIEYPERPGETVELAEAESAIDMARGMIDAATRLLPHLGFF